MNAHPDPIDGPATVPWEPLGQIRPEEIPEPSDKYPHPWTASGRGNGHFDLIDAQQRVFAHVYCWDEKDYDLMRSRLKQQ